MPATDYLAGCYIPVALQLAQPGRPEHQKIRRPRRHGSRSVAEVFEKRAARLHSVDGLRDRRQQLKRTTQKRKIMSGIPHWIGLVIWISHRFARETPVGRWVGAL